MLDIRHVNCANKNLSQYNAEQIEFDNGTIFPTDILKMPADFNNLLKNAGIKE